MPGPAERIEALENDAACIADIKTHLDTVGSENWIVVRQKYPTINERKFFNLLRKVKEGRPGYAPDESAITKTVSALRYWEQRGVAGEHVPAPPPAIVAAGGKAVRKRLDFMSHFDQMLADCDKLRDYALLKGPNGAETIKNPMYFMQQIKQRGNILETAIAAMRALWDVQKMQEFYDTIVSEIGKLDPETAATITERLRELDEERGFTMNARA